jgi:hypothetical protein
MIMGVFNDGSGSADVAAWFEARGLTVRISQSTTQARCGIARGAARGRRETITSGLICWRLTVG